MISKYIMCVCMYGGLRGTLGALLYRSSLYSLEIGDVGFPSICCESDWLFNKENCLSLLIGQKLGERGGLN